MEILRRWREPVAITLLVASGIRLLVGIIAVPVLAAEDAWGSVATAALFEGGRAADPLLLLATAAAAAWCLLPAPSPSGRTIAALAVVETGVAVVVSLVFGLMGLTADAVEGGVKGVESASLLTALVVPALAAVVLLALLRAAPVTAASRSVVDPRPIAEPVPDTPPVAPTPPALPPGWQPEQATGIVWRTAGEAAAGSPPSGWPTAGEPAGWQPIPGSPEQPGPPSPQHRSS